jgi:tetratricopeptide (TPR) repeat protein
MKKFCTAIICAMLLLNVNAQQRDIDSLKKLAGTAKDDTTKVNLLYQLSKYWSVSRPDSAMMMVRQILEISRRVNYLKGEAMGLNMQGNALIAVNGNYAKALSSYLSALKINEKRNDSLAIAKNLGNIGNVYSSEGDHRQSVTYLLKAKVLLEAIHNEEILLVAFTNLGEQYIYLDKMDSAQTYTRQGYKLAAKFKDTSNMGYNAATLGDIYQKMQKPKVALNYYRTALFYFKQVRNDDAFCSTLFTTADAFEKSNQPDSAIYYARRSFSMAKQDDFTATVLDASSFLADRFEKNGKADSALHYLRLSVAAKDSLFSQEKTKQVQNLSFAEHQRQEEIAEQKRLEDEANKKNLQLAGIAIFLPTFFFFVLFLSSRRIKAKTVDFLGVLLLMLTFEFISMLIRPYIVHIKSLVHDAPAITMFINIGLATLLVPVHRPIERWVKSRLTHSHINK